MTRPRTRERGCWRKSSMAPSGPPPRLDSVQSCVGWMIEAAGGGLAYHRVARHRGGRRAHDAYGTRAGSPPAPARAGAAHGVGRAAVPALPGPRHVEAWPVPAPAVDAGRAADAPDAALLVPPLPA